MALGHDETLWLDTWARCLLDALPYTTDPASLSLSRWVATDRRIVGRLATGVLAGWVWEDLLAHRADLSAGKKWAQVDPKDRPLVVWYDPGVALLAVALVAQVHGTTALLEHPGLAPLRVTTKPRERRPGPMPERPQRNDLDDVNDLLRGL